MIKISKILSKVNKILFICLFLSIHFSVHIYSEYLVNYYYKHRIQMIHAWKRSYNESNLLTFEDKMNWLAIHDVTKLKGKCSDKILLHEYSKRILKKDICNKILKIYENPYQINLKELPDQFVLKTNHGSGFNIIVSNRTEFDLDSAIHKLSEWLKIDYGKIGAEYHYSFIKRKVFAEEYIGANLNNYKFFCYDSKYYPIRSN